MKRLTKLDTALAIVDWEHRYKLGKLQGGEWCIRRIRQLMKMQIGQVGEVFHKTFALQDNPPPPKDDEAR